MAQLMSVRLHTSEMISSNTRKLSFELTDGPFSFRPGEFVSLQFQDEKGDFKRSYSIATLTDKPGEARQLEIVASFVEGGRATSWLWQAQTGADLQFVGPHGQLVMPEALPKRLILIATGTGVAPYRSMLRQIQSALQSNPDAEIRLLYGARVREEAFFLDDFRRLSSVQPRFHFQLCLSRQVPQANDEYAGRVSGCLQELRPELQSDLVYLCGNPAMVDEVYDALKAQGFGPKSVRREKYVFTRT